VVTNGVVYNSNDDRIITNYTSQENSIVLTFDDGPSRYLDDFLDILESENITAMFFWQARLLHHKRSWQRLIDGGNVIGSHANTHRNLAKLSYEEQKKELFFSKQKIEQITKQQVRFFRPPFGQFNEITLKVASDLKLQTMMWSVSSFDWALRHDEKEIIQNVLKHVENGSIILLHELKQTLEILPGLITELKNEGYNFTIM
jgi:peptidoglycan/xylan/chitin deacetylase (PgdA/CDA1 family)